MSDESRSAEKGPSTFEQIEARNASLLGDLLAYLSQNKKWWLLPIMTTLLVVGALALLSTTAAAPFIYTFF